MGVGARGIALAVVLGASACSPIFSNHGYVPNEQDLSLVTVGIDDRDSVLRLVGRPSSSGLMTDGAYFYVADRRRTFGPRAAEVIDREIVAISFDDAGSVANIERFGLEDGNVVALSRRVTETGVRRSGFLRQLFGNLGNLGANVLGDNAR